MPRWLVAAEVRVGRWRRTGQQTLQVHNGPVSPAGRRAACAAEVGPRAALDGVSALQHAGITSLTDDVVHVIAPKGSSPRRVRLTRVHESRRFREQDVLVLDGVRTVRSPVAAVHAALWARTDREAAMMLVLVVQQRLATPAELADAVELVRRHPRHRLLRSTAAEVAGGVRSTGELDVARGLRSRGLPEPERQVLRRRPSGRQYLDAHFAAYAVTLEIDGEQHAAAEARVADALRDLEEAADGSLVLRVPLLAWRFDREAVLDRLEAVFRSRGWRRAA